MGNRPTLSIEQRGSKSMNNLERQKKKRRIINLSIVAVCVLLVLGVVLTDYLTNRTTDATLTKEQAQAQMEELIGNLPTSVAKCSKYVVGATRLEVLSVKPGGERNYEVTVQYTTLDVKTLYEANKDEIFAMAWEYAEGVKAEGTKVNATMIQIHVQSYIMELLESAAEPLLGEVTVYFYDVREENLQMYLSDEALDALLGGLLDECDTGLGVAVAVGDFDLRRGGSYLNKSIPHGKTSFGVLSVVLTYLLYCFNKK